MWFWFSFSGSGCLRAQISGALIYKYTVQFAYYSIFCRTIQLQCFRRISVGLSQSLFKETYESWVCWIALGGGWKSLFPLAQPLVVFWSGLFLFLLWVECMCVGCFFCWVFFFGGCVLWVSPASLFVLKGFHHILNSLYPNQHGFPSL